MLKRPRSGEPGAGAGDRAVSVGEDTSHDETDGFEVPGVGAPSVCLSLVLTGAVTLGGVLGHELGRSAMGGAGAMLLVVVGVWKLTTLFGRGR